MPNGTADGDAPDAGRASPEDLERVFEAHYTAVLAALARQGQRASDADDLAAKAFAILWRRPEVLQRAPHEIRAWLVRTASYLSMHDARSERRAAELRVRLSGQPPNDYVTPEHVVLDDDQRAEVGRRVRALLGRLPDSQRTILEAALAAEASEDRAPGTGAVSAAERARRSRARQQLFAMYLETYGDPFAGGEGTTGR